MSIQALYTSATGMNAMETKLDVISNNLANINTTGFKRGIAQFQDLFYRHEILPGSQNSQGNLTPTGVSVGLGTRIQSVQTDLRQGNFKETGNQLDLAVEGRGFFQVIDPASGQFMYTRAGNFSINANGQVVMGSATNGRLLEPSINIPPDATGIVISSDGIVSIQQAGSPALQNAGNISLAYFLNPEGLLKVGENLYVESAASGSPQQSTPGLNGVGVIRQGFLEASNTDPAQELIDLITTQRGFELNSQTVQAADQMLQLVSNLRRF